MENTVRTNQIRERNRKRRSRGSGEGFNYLKLLLYVVYLVAATVLLIGILTSDFTMVIVGGALILAMSALYGVKTLFALLRADKRSPQFKSALESTIFFALMIIASALVIVFAVVEIVALIIV